MYCSECGSKVVDGSKFCSSCGKRLTGVPASSERMRAEAVVATSKQKTEGKRPLWRRVLGGRERTALRCVFGIVIWVVVLLVGMSLAHGSTGFDYIDMRTSEYVAKYGCSGLSGVQWLIFWIGILLNVAGIAMVYCWLQALLSRIRPANRTKSIWAKVLAVAICFLFYCGFSLLRWYGNDCKPCWSMWDTFILIAVCTAVWRGLVGVDKGNQSGKGKSANYDKATEIGGYSRKGSDAPDKSRLACWVIGIVGALLLIGVCVGVAFQRQVKQQKRIAQQALAAFEEKDYDRGLLFAAKVKDKDSRLQYFVGLCYANGYGSASSNDVEAVRWYRKAAEQGDADAQNNLGWMYDNGLGVEKDDVEAVRWYRKAAEQGDACAQFNLGVSYANGQGVGQNDVEAVRWYRKAAEQGYVSAQNNLGCMYQNGRGVGQNDVEAVCWYRKAAEQGYASAQNNLGLMYANGRSVEQDDVEAVRWYRKAAEQGYASAQNNLGCMYQNGRGVGQNDVEAVCWYRKAAEQGNAYAQNSLGCMYQNGRGVERSDVDAVRWYRKAVDQGHAYAQYNLGWMYEKGQGVGQSSAEAVRWYREAAEQGNADAQRALGRMYEIGLGIEKSDVDAVHWYRKAAEQGNADAQFNLGLKYYIGQGVERSSVEAVRWYRKAAEQGNAGAQWFIGLFYEYGIGIEKNDVQAVHWYRKAAEQGNAEAQRALDSMYKKGRGVEKKDDVVAVRVVAEKASQRPAAGEMLKLVATVDGKEVRLAKVKIGDKQELTPVFRTGLRKGDVVGPFHVTYEKDGNQYAQDFKPISVDWDGAKTFTFPLKIVDSSSKTEMNTEAGHSRNGGVQRSDLDELLRDMENKR